MNDQWDDNLIIDAYERSMSLINKKVNNLIATTANDDNLIEANQTIDDNSKCDKIIENDRTTVNENEDTNKSTGQSETEIQGGEKVWKVNDYCQALYNEDGLFYEAEIISIDGNNCTICYLGYGNVESKKLNELKESAGPENRLNQIEKYFAENDDVLTTSSQESNYSNHINQQAKLTNHLTDQLKSNQKQSKLKTTTSSILIPPPPANLPSLSSIDENELLTTTLMSWYMSGYHTGYYQAVRDLKKQSDTK